MKQMNNKKIEEVVQRIAKGLEQPVQVNPDGTTIVRTLQKPLQTYQTS